MVINNPSNINLLTLYLMTKENINAYVSDLRRSNMAIYLQLLNLFDNIRSQALNIIGE